MANIYRIYIYIYIHAWFLLCFAFISFSLLFEQYCNNFEAHLVFGFKKFSYTYNVVKIEEDLNMNLGFSWQNDMYS